jgi:hypothetical protein
MMNIKKEAQMSLFFYVLLTLFLNDQKPIDKMLLHQQ